jgi:hypothetical protein
LSCLLEIDKKYKRSILHNFIYILFLNYIYYKTDLIIFLLYCTNYLAISYN